MKLYDFQYSPNARKVRAFVSELAIACEIEQTDILQGESRTPGFLAQNPNGKVPLLVDGDFTLSESNAILVYLAEREGRRDWFPESVQERADVLRWLFWQTAHFSAPAAKLGFEIAIKPWLKGVPSDPEVADRLAQELAPWMTILDARLNDRDGVCGALSVADFALAAWVEMLAEKGWLGGYENVAAWFARIAALEGWKNTRSSSPG